ncbi:MAG TPA: hypothetical protein VN622_16910 [Clostridia bacterium]|nr:hypothetical protein [Clostridia bacterium]
MSLIELMLALTMLVVGMAGALVLITTAIAANNRNKVDTGATLAAQMVIETIAAQPGDTIVTIHDCNSTVAGGTSFNINTAGGGAPGTSAGAALVDGKIDFTQTVANVPLGYGMQYVACGSGGRQMTYDVRWNVRTNNPYSKVVTVSARQANLSAAANGNNLRFFTPPVTLRTIAVAGN